MPGDHSGVNHRVCCTGATPTPERPACAHKPTRTARSEISQSGHPLAKPAQPESATHSADPSIAHAQGADCEASTRPGLAALALRAVLGTAKDLTKGPGDLSTRSRAGVHAAQFRASNLCRALLTVPFRCQQLEPSLRSNIPAIRSSRFMHRQTGTCHPAKRRPVAVSSAHAVLSVGDTQGVAGSVCLDGAVTSGGQETNSGPAVA